MNVLSAAEIGSGLSRFCQGPLDNPNAQAFVRTAVEAMLATPGRSGMDALAFAALAENLTQMALANSADGLDEQARYILALAAALQHQAVATLESLIGTSGEAFSLAERRIH